MSATYISTSLPHLVDHGNRGGLAGFLDHDRGRLELLGPEPTHHFQNGGLLVSKMVSHLRSHVSIFAYSIKQSG